MMLDFIHLRPINGQEVGGIYTTPNRYACRANSLFEDNFSATHHFQAEAHLVQEVEAELQDPAFAVEYEDCPHRSSCGIDDENDKDNGMDSTFCLSTNGENMRVNIHARYAHNNRAMSHCGNKNGKLNEEFDRAPMSQYHQDD